MERVDLSGEHTLRTVEHGTDARGAGAWRGLTAVVALAALLLPLGVAPAAQAPAPAPAAPARVKIMVAGLDKQIYLPAKLAEALGAYKEQGLEVELFNSNSGSQAATALLAREVQGVVGFYDHTIDLQSKGKFISSVVQLAVAPGEVELVATSAAERIKSPADWKGQVLGVTGLGSATDFLTRYLAVKAGLKSSDVTLVPVGAGDTFLTAMQQGKIVAGMTTEPTVQRSLSTGAARILIDLRSPESTRAALGGDYPAAALYMENAYADANPEVAQKLVNAYVTTLRWMASHSSEEIADKMPKDYLAGDRAAYVRGLDDGRAQYSKDGRMPEGAPAFVLSVLKAFNPAVQAKEIDLSKTYTTRYVDRAQATN